MAQRLVFSVMTPLGYRVVLTRNRWREIVRYKHPALAGHETEVRLCVEDPDVIRASAKDLNIHLYYRPIDRGHLCVVVGGDNRNDRFIVTSYFTKNIKRGKQLWTK